MKSRLLLPLTLLCIACASCSTVYRMPEAEGVAATQIAILDTTFDPKGSVAVKQIDGRWRGFGMISRYELFPGPRTLTVSANVPGAISDSVYLKFNAVAGESYELKYDIRGMGTQSGSWDAWVVAKSNGRRVSERVR